MTARQQIDESTDAPLRNRLSIQREALARLDHELEPECTCRQTDVDLFDARGCELAFVNLIWPTLMLSFGPPLRYLFSGQSR